jgi:hypothetical protein
MRFTAQLLTKDEQLRIHNLSLRILKEGYPLPWG